MAEVRKVENGKEEGERKENGINRTSGEAVSKMKLRRTVGSEGHLRENRIKTAKILLLFACANADRKSFTARFSLSLVDFSVKYF